MISQSTLNDIIESKVINVKFDKYSKLTKIEFTYYSELYAITCTAWASITHAKYMRLAKYTDVIPTLKPVDYSAERINKATGETVAHNNPEKVKLMFAAICEELAKRTNTVHLDYSQQFRK